MYYIRRIPVTFCLASQNKNTPTTTKKNYKLISKSSLPRHVVGTQLPRQTLLDLLVEPLRLLLLPPPATSLRRKPHIIISHGRRVALESRNDNIDRVSSCVSNSRPFWVDVLSSLVPLPSRYVLLERQMLVVERPLVRTRPRRLIRYINERI